jgi:hypothetical protein
MIFEQLPSETLTEQLQIRREELNQLLTSKLKALNRAPKGHLRIAQARGGRKHQYYQITSRGDTKGTYLPHTQLPLIQRLAQKQYDESLIKILSRQVAAIDQLLAASGSKITDLYKNMCQARRLLITPVTLPDDQYVELWKAVVWQGLPFAEDAPEYFTANNVKVRSKSEILIADTLGRFNVPYRYEYPLELKDGRTFHPDFLCLNVRTRREYIWEHFGLLDDPAYASRAATKLLLFSENKIFLGKNLIITTETDAVHISSIQIDDFIKEFLL